MSAASSSSPTRTVLITGTSSGIGRACVDAFADRGWNVVATMRTPAAHAELASDAAATRGAVHLARLDVTDADSIDAAFDSAIERFRHVDCVVNNAGYGLTGVFETMDDAQLAAQFDTNVLGLMRVCRRAITHMRPRGAGTIINVTSVGGRVAFPLYSPYHATKWAVEGFSESLHYELEPLGIRVRIAEPGPVVTDFYGRSRTEAKQDLPVEYAFALPAMEGMDKVGSRGARPEQVAAQIVRAAESTGSRLRWPTDRTARQLMLMRAITPNRLFRSITRKTVFRGGAGA